MVVEVGFHGDEFGGGGVEFWLLEVEAMKLVRNSIGLDKVE